MNENNLDFIGDLPKEVLTIILSKLRIDEAIRCGVLSSQWLGLWKETPHIEFELRHMVKPITRLLLTRELQTDPDFNTWWPSTCQSAYASSVQVFSVMHGHLGDITSCRIKHFKKSLAFGYPEAWLELLVEKRKSLTDLSLECVLNNGESTEKSIEQEEIYRPLFACGIFSRLGSLELTNYTLDSWAPFEECTKLKTLKMKRIYIDDMTLMCILDNCRVLENLSLVESSEFVKIIVMKSMLKVLQLQALCVEEIEIAGKSLEVLLLDSVICLNNNITICAPNLKDFHSYCSSIFARMISAIKQKSIMKTNEILALCYEFSDSPTYSNAIRNISFMSLDLDLNNIREVMSLSYTMRLSPHLQCLQITIPVFKNKDYDGNSNNVEQYSNSFFWKYRKLCNCTRFKLKFVKVKGFTGKALEVEFAEYLITRVHILEKLIIICRDSMDNNVAEKLFSLPRASSNLSIHLRFSAKNCMDEFAELQNRLLMW